MANYLDLKAAVAAVIKANGNNEITGDVLKSALLSIVDSLGKYPGYAGVATPQTLPGNPDANVFFLANKAGDYPNFGLSIPESGLYILANNGQGWSVDLAMPDIDISELASKEEVENIESILTSETISYNDTVPGAIGDTGANANSTVANRTGFIPVNEGDIISAKVRGWSATGPIVYMYRSTNPAIFASGALFQTGRPETLEITFVVPPGITYVRAKTMNSSDPNYIPYDFFIKKIGVVDRSKKGAEAKIILDKVIGFLPDITGASITLDLGRSDNFAVLVEGTQDKRIFIPFKGDRSEKSISILMKMKSNAIVNFPLNVIWQNNQKPLLLAGNDYMILLQTFDRGGYWLGSVVGAWKHVTSIIDDLFNRADDLISLGMSTNGNPWVYNGSTWGIQAGRAINFANSGSYPRNIAYVDSGISDCVIEATLPMGDNDNSRIVFRVRDNENFYYFGRSNPGSISFGWISANTANSVQTWSYSPKEGDILKVICIGNDLGFFINNIQLGFHNNTWNSGETKHGLFGTQSLTAIFDNFKVYYI